MLDSHIRPLIDPVLNRMGRAIAARDITANEVTLAGLGLGLISAVMLGFGLPGELALVVLLLGRLADGLDGAVARATTKTDFGGYLDILADFAFYGAIPFAFLIRDPGNAVPAALLLLAFYINGASFLGYAILAEKRGMETAAQGEKTLYYSAGFLEGTETIAFFVAFCLWPAAFPTLATVFALLCLATTLARLTLARRVFRG